MERTPCQIVTDVVQRVGGRSRLKLRGEGEPEPWGDWMISPTPAYLEEAGCGPWPWREVEWVEVEPSAIDVASVAEAFAGAGLPVEIVGNAVRAYCVG